MRFLNRPLSVLERLYRFVGGLATTTEVHLRSGVQLVHDVTGEVERAAGFLFANFEAHGAALGATDRFQTPRSTYVSGASSSLPAEFVARLSSLGLDANNSDLWLVDVFYIVDTASPNLANCQAGLVVAGVAGRTKLLYHGDTLGPGPLVAGGTRNVFSSAGGKGLPQRRTLPIFLPDVVGTNMAYFVEASGVGAVAGFWVTLFWIGARGTLPPVMQ